MLCVTWFKKISLVAVLLNTFKCTHVPLSKPLALAMGWIPSPKVLTPRLCIVPDRLWGPHTWVRFQLSRPPWDLGHANEVSKPPFSHVKMETVTAPTS